MKIARIVILTILILLIVLVLTVCGYIAYLQINYYRIEDGIELPVNNQSNKIIQIGKPYSIMTYNIGFGAYDHDFSFFMDKGRMNDGTEVCGKYGKARGKESVQSNTSGAIGIIRNYNADFYILQEVDTASTRSYFINQKKIIESTLSDYCSVYGVNFHSSYLCYPLGDPHGSVCAGLLTLSRYKIGKAVRRSYPVDESFITKFFDLDRCFVVTRIPTNTEKELVIINSHMSAYDEGGQIRQQQLELLKGVLAEEYSNGNFVIVGGDFNHALCGTVNSFASQQQVPEWVSVLEDSEIPAHFRIVAAQNIKDVPTCRSTDMPYRKGVNYTTVLDGFIVSDNIEAEAINCDADFMYSDHNPVVMNFKLIKNE